MRNMNQHESNALNQSIVPLARTSAGTANQPNNLFEINVMGNMEVCKFYIPDVTGDTTGLAFRVAYNAVKLSGYRDYKAICSYVGSMLCSVVPAFRNSVEVALNGVGIMPRFVSLPSQANENNILISDVPELDWSSILVVFGYCILVLFKIDNSELFETPERPNSDRIREMKQKVGCSESTRFHVLPFSKDIENEVRTMLGTRDLRTSVLNFLINSLDHSDKKISSLCNYLCYKLSWSGDLRVLNVMNDRLVKTKSPVLSDSRVIAEAENLEELFKAVAAQTYPQYFNHLCSPSELLHLDVSRFPNLFYVALELESGYDNGRNYVSGTNEDTVEELVKLHQTSMKRKGVSTARKMPKVPGI